MAYELIHQRWKSSASINEWWNPRYEFADFFMNKIQKIRDALDKHPKYNSCSKEVVSLDSFKLLSEKQVKSIIASMSTKSCELDVLPTQLLKDILDRILTPITHLVNTSLQKGIFSPSWKEAIIRPLIKKAGLDLVYKNFRPVSNLSFLSKVVEKISTDTI